MRLGNVTPLDMAVAAMLVLASPLAAAQVYKWVDERGVTNYSNEVPPKTRGSKPPTVVEDRISTYTPDQATTQAVQGARERRNAAAPGGSSTREGQANQRPSTSSAAPPPAVLAADPCATGGNVNCYGYPGYDGVYGRQRPPPRLVQPQLPQGATAGNVNGGNGFIPGLSGQQSQTVITPARTPGASFTLKEDPTDRSRRSR